VTGIAATAASLALLFAVSPAPGSTRHTVSLRFLFTATQPSLPTGSHVVITYHDPGEPNDKPPAVRRSTVLYPAGTRFDGGAIRACRATDHELMQKARNACPAASRVGGGEVEVVTGFGRPADPMTLDETTFNEGHSLILLFTDKVTGRTQAVERQRIKGRAFTTESPVSCVPPGQPPRCEPFGQFAVKRFEASAPPLTRGPRWSRRALFSTPNRCPRSHHWTFAVEFTFADGSKRTAKSASPCAQPRERM
jgi:hypothetical protein